MSEAEEVLSQFKAALLVEMSPTLLEWFTSYSVKEKGSRKLQRHHKDEWRSYYTRGELVRFNKWLKDPWPCKEGGRPGVPLGIQDEIKEEAGNKCALCGKYGDVCEAAHIDPVSTSKNNHPENLIWLCSNCHTAYDKAVFSKKRSDDAEFIRAHKRTLVTWRKRQWADHGEVDDRLLTLLQLCVDLNRNFADAKTDEQRGAVERLGKEATVILYQTAMTSAPPGVAEIRKKFLPRLQHASGEDSDIGATLREAQQIKEGYVAALGYIACPLCNATGRFNGDDCPVCHGNREIDEQFARHVDLSQFTQVSCPLCEGAKRHNGNECPACQGDGTLERRFADRVDRTQFDLILCPLCKGSGRRHGEDCAVCAGDKRIERRYADQVDLAQYDVVPCPVCEGNGKHNGDWCIPCDGEGKLERHQADQIDPSQYQYVPCPLCVGDRHFQGDDCPPCQGTGRMERHQAEMVDISQYELVDCPACGGTGSYRDYDCGYCDGRKRVPRYHADRFNF